jgi:hypothetical protein
MGRTAGRALRSGLGALISLLVALGWSETATALDIEISGVDIQSEYTGFNPVVPDSGVFTFYDSMSGMNPNPERGTVTTESQPLGLVDGRIDLEIMLDTSSFDPAVDNLLGAPFTGTGVPNEILIWDSTETTVLLAFGVDFIDVTGVTPQYLPYLPSSIITLGENVLSGVGVSSRLLVQGGSLADAVGGIGTQAVLQLTISNPDPQVTTTNMNGYLDDSFSVGIPPDPPTNGVNWEITIVPEPTTSLLIGGSLTLWAALKRRRRLLA